MPHRKRERIRRRWYRCRNTCGAVPVLLWSAFSLRNLGVVRPTAHKEEAVPSRQAHTAATASIHHHHHHNRNHQNVSTSFLTFDDYHRVRNHVYAAAWWQSVDRLQRVLAWIPTQTNQTLAKLEAACHLPLEFKPADVRLTTDWLDLGVEHLSKWWKMTRYQKHYASYQTLGHHLADYITQSMAAGSSSSPSQSSIDNPWQKTLAVVAYSPLVGPRQPQRAQRLDTVVTAATLASLVRQGVSRIVLFLDHTDVTQFLQYTWPYIVQWLQVRSTDQNSSSTSSSSSSSPWEDMWQTTKPPPSQSSVPNPVRIHHTDIYWQAVDARVPEGPSQGLKRVPRQVLLALGQAMQAANPPPWFHKSTVHYIYYTEQDSILHATTQSLKMIQQSLDQDGLWIPHRWQPLPHATDFAEHPANDNLPAWFYVPDTAPWDRVQTLDAAAAAASCCDEGWESTVDFSNNPPCNDFWYQCGLGVHADRGHTVAERLAHLRPFSLVRLQQGTRLTLLAASEHARQCRPSTRPCG